jgi:alpha-glucosidase
MILNLNEPTQYEDVSWIKPMKYIGIWWDMHVRTKSWFTGPVHGATTEYVKKHIDFAAEHGFDAVLVEGWNVGWAMDETFDYTRPYPDFDFEELSVYAREKDVRIMGHHETYGDVTNYEDQLEKALDLYEKMGVNSVKTGYVGALNPEGEFHHGQWMVNHHLKVVEEAASRKIMVNVHEPIKDTGLRRTFPNMISREGVRGSEFNAPWGGGNPPEHLTIVPFTRGLAGPIDYTPGLVRLDLNEYVEGYVIPSTISYQLAAYVVIYSPIQMASDLIAHYEERLDALQFIKEVPVDWQETRVLNGEIGDYITVARKDRNSDNWFLGSVTDENARELEISLSFLDSGKTYMAYPPPGTSFRIWVSESVTSMVSISSRV